jgi:hypothetical protein
LIVENEEEGLFRKTQESLKYGSKCKRNSEGKIAVIWLRDRIASKTKVNLLLITATVKIE